MLFRKLEKKIFYILLVASNSQHIFLSRLGLYSLSWSIFWNRSTLHCSSISSSHIPVSSSSSRAHSPQVTYPQLIAQLCSQFPRVSYSKHWGSALWWQRLVTLELNSLVPLFYISGALPPCSQTSLPWPSSPASCPYINNHAQWIHLLKMLHHSCILSQYLSLSLYTEELSRKNNALSSPPIFQIKIEDNY